MSTIKSSWNRTMPNFSIPLLLCILYAVVSTVDAQFGPWSSRGVRSVNDRSPDPEPSHDFTGKHSLLHSNLDGDSENDDHLQSHQGTESAEPFSSTSSRRTFEIASETAQDIWHMLNSSITNISTHQSHRNDRAEQLEADPISVDEVLQHIGAVIRILSNTQKALLDKKASNLPFVQRIMFKYFYSHRDPLPTEHQRLSSLSNLSSSARDFTTILANTNALKENINAVTTTFAKELLLSISALKDAARNAAHGGWLVTPQVRAYVHELTQSFSTQSEKWMQRIGKLAEAARPMTGNISSKDIQALLTDIEGMVMEFQDEIWRMRTELVYRRRETLSWATDSLYAMKQQGMHEFDRLSEIVHIRGRRAKQMLREGFERNLANAAYLQQYTAERVNHFIDLVVLWIDITKGLLRTVAEIFISVVKKLWRIIAFVAVIVFFRFLLNMLQANPSVTYFVSGTFSRTNATNSSPLDTRPTPNRAPQTTKPDSPARSEHSESKSTAKELSAENDAAPNVPGLSKSDGPASPSNSIIVNSTAQRQVRRTPSRAAKTLGEGRPLQVSNLDYQGFLSTLGQGGQPIHIGDHEVKMVYNSAPSDSPIGNSKGDIDGKKKSTGNKGSGIQRISRREGKQMASERYNQVNDDDSVSGTTSGFESANSRQTRSSARRTSARRSHLR